MDPRPEDPIEFFAKPAGFERWLKRNGSKASCVWVKVAKKKSGITSMNWDQAGRPERARPLLHRLVDEEWAENYRSLREQAFQRLRQR